MTDPRLPQAAADRKEAAHPVVRGRCPSCGSRSLFLGAGGYVTCAYLECQNPSAVSELLGALRAVERSRT